MERPMHFDARATSVSPSRMTMAVTLAVLLEAGAIYLVGSGLGPQILRALPQPLTINIFEPPTKVVELPPPPQSQFVKPSLPAVARPIIDFQTSPPTNPIATAPSQRPAATQPTTVATAQPPVRTLIEPVPPRGIGATHTQPPYPMLARRLGKEGIVVLDMTIGIDGTVQNVSVAKSSGDNDLDLEASNWVKAHWRYQPATQNGQPVVARSEAQIVFNLKQSSK